MENQDTTLPPVFGLSTATVNGEAVADPWEGYPREALIRVAKQLAGWYPKYSFHAALGHVVRFFDAKGRLPRVIVPAPFLAAEVHVLENGPELDLMAEVLCGEPAPVDAVGAGA